MEQVIGIMICVLGVWWMGTTKEVMGKKKIDAWNRRFKNTGGDLKCARAKAGKSILLV